MVSSRFLFFFSFASCKGEGVCHEWEGSKHTNQTAAERTKAKSYNARPASIGHPAVARQLVFAGLLLISRTLQRLSDAVGDYQKGIASAP